MDIRIISKSENDRILVIEVDGAPWREISKQIFKYKTRALLQCVDIDSLQEVWTKTEQKAAEGYVLRLLLRKTYFSTELHRHLKLKLFSQPAIEFALDRMKKLGYIDDEHTRERLIAKETAKGRGPRIIAQKLKAVGASTTMTMDQADQITRLLSTRLRKYDLSKPIDFRKAVHSLQRRGFDLDCILSVLRF